MDRFRGEGYWGGGLLTRLAVDNKMPEQGEMVPTSMTQCSDGRECSSNDDEQHGQKTLGRPYLQLAVSGGVIWWGFCYVEVGLF